MDNKDVIVHETQKSITDWGIKTFGYPSSPRAIIDRMFMEIDELKYLVVNMSLTNKEQYEDVADECADIYIVMCQVMNTIGYDLQSCVNHKMTINRARKWKLNQDGTGQHIKE